MISLKGKVKPSPPCLSHTDCKHEQVIETPTVESETLHAYAIAL